MSHMPHQHSSWLQQGLQCGPPPHAPHLGNRLWPPGKKRHSLPSASWTWRRTERDFCAFYGTIPSIATMNPQGLSGVLLISVHPASQKHFWSTCVCSANSLSELWPQCLHLQHERAGRVLLIPSVDSPWLHHYWIWSKMQLRTSTFTSDTVLWPLSQWEHMQSDGLRPQHSHCPPSCCSAQQSGRVRVTSTGIQLGFHNHIHILSKLSCILCSGDICYG